MVSLTKKILEFMHDNGFEVGPWDDLNWHHDDDLIDNHDKEYGDYNHNKNDHKYNHHYANGSVNYL